MNGVAGATGGLTLSFASSIACAAPAPPAIELTNRTLECELNSVHQPLTGLGSDWMGGGMAVGDFNRDGLADLFVVTGGSSPDHLYINDGDGTFTDEAADWGLTDLHCGNGVSVADYDDNGWLDIFVTSYGPVGLAPVVGHHRLHHNNGDGTFTDKATDAGVNLTSTGPAGYEAFGSAWGDYDKDGDLDLFVATWQPPPPMSPQYGNRLFRNDGDGTFTDVSDATFGVAPLEYVGGFQPAFVDMDRDGWPELLLAADWGTSRYFRNNTDGTFSDITGSTGTGLDSNGMGQTVADFDNDGRFDWYVTSVHSDPPIPGAPPTSGNMLYLAVDDHLFAESSMGAQVNDGGWGWGTVAVDLNQDGWTDIVEVNGWEWSPPGQWTTERAKLFRNEADGTFTETAQTSGLDHALSGRAVVRFDLENDGDMDLAVFSNSGPVEVYRNDSTGAGNWLQIAFDNSTNPHTAPDGFGTRVTLTAGGVSQMRELNGSPSFLSTSQLLMHFGLGEATTIDALTVDWPRGNSTTVNGVGVNLRLTLRPPAPEDVDASGFISIDDLVEVILHWGQTTGPADVNFDGTIGIDDVVAVVLAWIV
jgi:hypothetical protein